MEDVSSSGAVKVDEFLKLKEYDAMSGVLRAIGLDDGQGKFIEVWKRFDGPMQGLRSPSSNFAVNGTGKLAVVAKLARDFVSGIPVGN